MNVEENATVVVANVDWTDETLEEGAPSQSISIEHCINLKGELTVCVNVPKISRFFGALFYFG
jgi:hypothetical protein